jgi:hypothetical protein
MFGTPKPGGAKIQPLSVLSSYMSGGVKVDDELKATKYLKPDELFYKPVSARTLDIGPGGVPE